MGEKLYNYKKGEIVRPFFALLKAGLWEQDVRLQLFEPLDFEALFQMADDQSVVGLLAAGLEHVVDRKVTKPEAIPFLTKVFSLETRNRAMNSFIEEQVLKMRRAGIYSLLVKGQGVAQCYSRPLWRASGDIDFLLDADNYEKAKLLMIKNASNVKPEGNYTKHLGMTIDSWTVELHGTLRCGLSFGVDKVLDIIQEDTFKNGLIRAWHTNDTDIFLLGPENEALYIFTHILDHFFKGGIGLRQICDWCRLLWTYRESMNISLLEHRLWKMGLISEWKAFASFAVTDLGMPSYAMPLYDPSMKWKRKAKRIQAFILKVGNFGMNRNMGYYQKYSYFTRKVVSFGRRCGDTLGHSLIFPMGSFRFFPQIVFNGLKSAIKGE